MNLENIISIAAESGFNVDEKSRKYQKLFIFFGIHSCQEELLTFAELVAAAERKAIESEWWMCVQSDLENGVKSLNEKAAKEFNKNYPKISKFGAFLNERGKS